MRVNTVRQLIVLLVVALVCFAPAARCEQSQKTSRPNQDDRLKKLEERVDAAEKAASSAAMEKDYITRIQKQSEAYYQKVLNTQIWTLGIMGLILTGVFVLVARFSLRMIDEQTKTAVAGATVQMRNEYARAVAKETQKLWDSNAADIKKLKETTTAQFDDLEQNFKERSEFQMQLVQALADGLEDPQADPLFSFRSALGIYKSGKSRHIIETKMGATAIRFLFESLRKSHPDNYLQQAREELADPLYNDLHEELALAALQKSWLTPLINERNPVPAAPPHPEQASQSPPAAPLPQVNVNDTELLLDEESDSCRLITS